MSGEPATVAAVAAAIEEPEEAEQLDLLAPGQARTDAARDAVARRGAGRPPGARNKRTERTLRWLMTHHRDPRERLLSVTDMHPHDPGGAAGLQASRGVAGDPTVRGGGPAVRGAAPAAGDRRPEPQRRLPDDQRGRPDRARGRRRRARGEYP